MGESLSAARPPASTTEKTDTPGRAVCVRYSMRNVITAMTAMKPSMFLVPKMPWIGPNCAMWPWMPRKRMGVSSRIPASTSIPSEIDSSHRSTSASARTVCSVSRMWPSTIARNARAAVDTQLHTEPGRSKLQNTLASAQPTKTTRDVGTRRTSEISRRRARRMAAPSTQSPARIDTKVTRPAMRSTANADRTAPSTVRV